jgi:HlyD family secretion protein
MKRVFIFLFLLVVVVLLAAMGKYFSDQMKKDPVVYKTEKAHFDKISSKTVATGSIVPRKEVEVKAQVSGVVESIYVEAGQIVNQGDLLAKIRVIPDEAALEAARQNVQSAQIDFDSKEIERKRQKDLLDDGVISAASYREFELSADLAGQNLKAAQSSLEVIRTGAARGSKMATNQVRATASGMVLDVPIKEGAAVIQSNNFNDGTTVVTVADMTEMVFEGKVDESEVAKLTEGMMLDLTVGAIEDLNFQAQLDFISPKGITEDGTIKFEIRASVQLQEDAFIRAGYSANADIVLETRDSVLVLEEKLLQFAGDTAYVEIQISDQEFERRDLELGLSDGVIVEILSGVDTTQAIKVPLEAGQEVTEE